MKLRYKILFSIIFMVLIIWLISTQINIYTLNESLTSANKYFLVFSFLFFFGSCWARIERWRIFLNPQEILRTRDLWSSMFIGYFVNIIIPARFGEFVRSYALSKKTSFSVTYILGTIIVEKVMDIGALLSFFLIFCFFFRIASWTIELLIIIVITLVVLLIFLFISIYYTDYIKRLTSGLTKKLPRKLSKLTLDKWILSIIQGFGTLRSPVKIVQTVTWTFLSWGFSLMMCACIIMSLGIEPWFPAALLALVVTNLGMLIPLTPAYIGIYHYMSILSLSFFNIDTSLALSYGIISHLIIFGSFTIIGGIAFWISGIQLMNLYIEER